MPKTLKNGTYVIDLDEFLSLGRHLMVMYVNGNSVPYFDTLGDEHIPEEIKRFIDNKQQISSKYRPMTQ